MPLTSMTGYGRGEASARGIRVEVELSSVNRRQFDVRINLPRTLASLEARMHSVVHGVVSRGQVSGVVKITAAGAGRAAHAVVDDDLAGQFVRHLKRTARRLGVSPELTAGDLVRMPGVLSAEAQFDEPSRVWPLMRRALQEALRHLSAMRGREGAALQKDITKRLAALRRFREQIARRTPILVTQYRRQLLARLHEAGVAVAADDPQIIKDLAIFAERSDISEELVRLESHLDQADKLLTATKPVGRTIDFLCQEMFREINTVASKAPDAAISRHVIHFKAELEAVREQVQNVE